ncbi:hypothetical protein [Promicromonospora sp. NPDC019610]|uniref:hypothetical protein n=1 Tax=Promicromonospora sp. NPDC019610 TaxID=3364405 RepID=UPI003796929B
MLLVVLETDRASIRAARVTTEVERADSAALIVPEALTSLGSRIAVWIDLARELPVRVLDRHLGSLEPTALNESASGEPRPARGAESYSPIDASREARARVEDELEELANARWAPVSTGRLVDLLRQAGITGARLADLPGIGLADALKIIRGQRPVTETQAQALAARTGRPAAEWIQANPALPEDLVAALDQPSSRSRVIALAKTRNQDEIDAWREAGYEVFALAARQTGEQKSPDWPTRVDRYFTAHRV